MIFEGVITNDAGTGPAIAFNAADNVEGTVKSRPLVVFRNDNVAKVTIKANGTVTATSFRPSPSRELKKNIVELDSRVAAEAFEQLAPVEFVYKEDANSRV